MRRVRPDVSHRIRRQPSIFSVRWFRIALGAGIVLGLALLVGPSLANWFGSDLPRSLFLLAPWGSSQKTAQARPPEPQVSRPSLSSPGALRPIWPRRLRGRSPRRRRALRRSLSRAAPPRAASAAPAPSAAARRRRRRRPPRGRRSRRARRLHRPSAPPTAEPLATPPAVYWVQVGRLPRSQNADRLVERLKGDGLSRDDHVLRAEPRSLPGAPGRLRGRSAQ